ncbi:hypothetical protein KAOT1_03037 [Kordia algicida OT-1]|uniref:Uncharacterized protein n=1 Tax=Kordia algicida OT-1 TaxID=391587 RepID=A9DUY7_9FLAO|nr:hypothetical protein KAOT1_03037 [Kordia algicida OT-1]
MFQTAFSIHKTAITAQKTKYLKHFLKK